MTEGALNRVAPRDLPIAGATGERRSGIGLNPGAKEEDQKKKRRQRPAKERLDRP